MPTGIKIISMPITAATAFELALLVKGYFDFTEGDFHLETKTVKDAQPIDVKIWDREPEPPTLTGLTLYLGFNSREEYSDYEASGEFALILLRGRLQIEAAYEKKLHHQSPAGAIFALKSMGWNEKTEIKPLSDDASKTLKIVIVESGPLPVGDEKEVLLL